MRFHISAELHCVPATAFVALGFGGHWSAKAFSSSLNFSVLSELRSMQMFLLKLMFIEAFNVWMKLTPTYLILFWERFTYSSFGFFFANKSLSIFSMSHATLRCETLANLGKNSSGQTRFLWDRWYWSKKAKKAFKLGKKSWMLLGQWRVRQRQRSISQLDGKL